MNSLIYCVDCDNDGVSRTFYTWKIDYTNDTVTEIGDFTDTDILYARDIFLVGGAVRVVATARTPGLVAAIYNGGVDPCVLLSTSGTGAQYIYKGVLINNKFYFAIYSNIFVYDEDTTTLSPLDDLAATHTGTVSEQFWYMSYDDIDIIYIILIND